MTAKAESHPLLRTEPREEHEKAPRNLWVIGKAVAVAVMAISGVVALNYGSKSVATLASQGKSDRSNKATSTDGDAATSTPRVSSYSYTGIETDVEPYLTATTEYGQVSADAYPWVNGRKIVEPYRKTTLAVENLDESISGDAHLYIWTITQDETGTKEAPITDKTGTNTFSHQFIIPGTYNVQVLIRGESGDDLGTFETDVLCRYVKRELRTLTDDDRDMFTTAASQLWKHNQSTGRAIYGDDFTSISEFVLNHASSATGDVYCDQWHEGTGFMAHHFALTIAFENSVRAVNPAVTIPYWDFTIEGEAIKSVSGDPSMLASTSPVFNADWFGTAETSGDYHILDGKWAHTSVIMLSEVETQVKNNNINTEHITNSYGVVTAPWNNNNDKELSRVMAGVCGRTPTNKPIPSCADHQMLANLTDLYQFMVLLPGVGHGPMHVNTGGVFGDCEDQFVNFYNDFHDVFNVNVTMGPSATVESDDFVIPDKDLDSGKYTVYTKKDLFIEHMHLEFFHMYRTLWRSQTCAKDGEPLHLDCPESCDIDTPQEECLCTCTGVYDDDFDWKNIEPCLYASNKTEELMHTILDEDMRETFTKFVCTAGVKEGQQLESASPLDIVFWMIHPILDRLATAKRLSSASTKIAFGTNMGQVQNFQTLDWVDYSYYNNYPDDYHCYGHGKSDLVLSGIPMLEWTERQVRGGNDNMTNWDFFLATDPTVFEAVDYIYDGFTWDHCDGNSDWNQDDDA